MTLVEVTVKSEGRKKFKDTGPLIRKIIWGIGKVGEVEAKKPPPKGVPYKTGNLRRATAFKMNNDQSGTLLYGTDYAEGLDKGTKAHRIVPVKAKALKFKIGGKIVFAKSVNHPGTKALHFTERHVNRMDNKAQATVDAVVARWFA